MQFWEKEYAKAGSKAEWLEQRIEDERRRQKVRLLVLFEFIFIYDIAAYVGRLRMVGVVCTTGLSSSTTDREKSQISVSMILQRGHSFYSFLVSSITFEKWVGETSTLK